MKALLISIFIIYLGIRFVCAGTVILSLCFEYEKPNFMELIRILIRPCKIFGQLMKDEYPISSSEENIKYCEEQILKDREHIAYLREMIKEQEKYLTNK